jgi:hypothetical protein
VSYFPTPGDARDTLSPWYELGVLYDGAAGEARRATMLGFFTACVVGALVLLSAPLFGTGWAGPFATSIPAGAGLLTGGACYGWRRAAFLERCATLCRTLAEASEDAARPTTGGLGAYYDAQLILLRCEYEYLLTRRGSRAARSARLLEETFGFTPEDPFECGPLNVAPDTNSMRELRERWEASLASRRAPGEHPPALGLREDVSYRVFPREMTVPVELAVRGAYLEISNTMLRARHGRDPLDSMDVPDEVRYRVERDLGEYAALTRKLPRR